MTEIVREDSPWKPGNPTDAVIPPEADDVYHLRSGEDIWFVYIQKAYITAEAHRTIEKFGYSVTVEVRNQYCLDEVDAEIVAVDLSRSEAEQLLADFVVSHETREQLEQVMWDE